MYVDADVSQAAMVYNFAIAAFACDELRNAIEHAVAAASVRERLAALDITPDFAPGPVMEAFLQTEIKNWRSFIEAKGITSQ